MSERMTGIHLPSLGAGSGYQEYGRQTREHMIQRFRRRAEIAKEEAERILDAPDIEFVVETYLGPYAQRKREAVGPTATDTEAVSPGRKVTAEELLERVREARLLHRDNGHGGCTTCLTYTSPMPQPRPWPCATARALGIETSTDKEPS